MFNAINTKKQGDLGLASAINDLIKLGTISIPLTDSQDYDLIIDIDGPKRVQVKTTSYIRNGNYIVQLSVKGGNKSSSSVKKFDPLKVDYLYALTDKQERYFIPVNKIVVRHSLTLNKKWNIYKI